MSRGFVHVNGADYELAYPVDERSAYNLRERLTPAQPNPTVQRVEVTLRGETATLAIDMTKVWASAVWFEPEVTEIRVF